MATSALAYADVPQPPSRLRTSMVALAMSLLSAVLPGLGQLAQKRILRGALYLAGFLAIITIAFLVRAASTYAGYLLLLFSLFGYNAVSSCDAFFAPRPAGARNPFALLLVISLTAAFLFACIQWAALNRLSGFKLFEVPSSGMATTIEKGSQIIVDRRAYNAHPPERGDVVVFKREGTYFAKRVIGLPGEVISISAGVVSVSGHPIEERYAHFTGGLGPYGRDFAEISVPGNAYFVLGDNRDLSLDSRDSKIGMVNRAEVIGRVLYVANSPRIGGRVDKDRPAPVPGGPES